MLGLLAGLGILTGLFAVCALLIRPDESTPERAVTDRRAGGRP